MGQKHRNIERTYIYIVTFTYPWRQNVYISFLEANFQRCYSTRNVIIIKYWNTCLNISEWLFEKWHHHHSNMEVQTQEYLGLFTDRHKYLSLQWRNICITAQTCSSKGHSGRNIQRNNNFKHMLENAFKNFISGVAFIKDLIYLSLTSMGIGMRSSVRKQKCVRWPKCLNKSSHHISTSFYTTYMQGIKCRSSA